MNIGSIGYATNQGLGLMAKQFFDNGIINRFLIVPHHHHANHSEWYGDMARIFIPHNYEWFLKDLDCLFLFENPFDWKIIPMARERGIKTVFQPNECTRFPFFYEPDVVHCPTELEMKIYKNGTLIPVPVDVPFKLRKNAEVFIHNAGHGGLGGRNGTRELIEAMKYVKSPIKLIIRTQTKGFTCNDSRVTIVEGTIPYEELFSEGDVFIFPDKFAGLSLPLQEAYASGMLVMTTNRFPNNTWLPNEPLITIESEEPKVIVQKVMSAIISPQKIAETIDAWYGKDIEKFSQRGRRWAEENSWKNLYPKYMNICKQ